jgi:hypothetical protein
MARSRWINEWVARRYAHAPCSCGSGKKRHKCHPATQPPTREEVRQALLRSRASTCLYLEAPNGCDGKIIEAHTISRTSLRRVADAGHVLIPTQDILTFDKHAPVAMKRVGISRATTFAGFCARHDNLIFSLIDTKPIAPSQDQLLLLAYRTWAQRVHQLLGTVDMMEFARGIYGGPRTSDPRLLWSRAQTNATHVLLEKLPPRRGGISRACAGVRVISCRECPARGELSRWWWR